MTKTNAMRLLEAAKIPFEVMEYEVDENNLSGVNTAKKTGKDPSQIFKTLVFSGEKQGYGVCCIPACEELDLKKTAKAFGEKKVEMLHVKDLLKVTGYIRGGCSPVGMKKLFPTVIDETSILFDSMPEKLPSSADTIIAEDRINTHKSIVKIFFVLFISILLCSIGYSCPL